MEQSITVDIAAPPERVWEILSDIERWSEWTESVTSATRLDAGPLQTGSKARLEQPKLPPTEYVVTTCLPGHSFTWVAKSTGVQTTASHTLEPLPDGGTRVRLGVEQSGVLGVVMGRLFFKGLTDRYLATEAAGLKARSEGTR